LTWPAPGDFEALARQYWNAWGDTLRTGMPGGAGASPANAAMGGAQAWHNAVDWWSQLAMASVPK
jgi:hypothetical protein